MIEFLHWLTTDTWGQFILGIIGNLVASALCFLAGGRWLWKKHGHHIKAHFQRVQEVHAAMQADK